MTTWSKNVALAESARRHEHAGTRAPLWLVRHAQPLIASGVCYGASNIAADARATLVAAQMLAQTLPQGVALISSPLQRCELLAQVLQGLRPDLAYKLDTRLAEMDFGQWEGQCWDAIDRCELDAWTHDFAHWRCGGGESVQGFMARVACIWDETQKTNQATAWITHAGVIRAAKLIAGGQRCINRADQWPKHAPGFGQWLVLECGLHPKQSENSVPLWRL